MAAQEVGQDKGQRVRWTGLYGLRLALLWLLRMRMLMRLARCALGLRLALALALRLRAARSLGWALAALLCALGHLLHLLPSDVLNELGDSHAHLLCLLLELSLHHGDLFWRWRRGAWWPSELNLRTLLGRRLLWWRLVCHGELKELMLSICCFSVLQVASQLLVRGEGAVVVVVVMLEQC